MNPIFQTQNLGKEDCYTYDALIARLFIEGFEFIEPRICLCEAIFLQYIKLALDWPKVYTCAAINCAEVTPAHIGL